MENIGIIEAGGLAASIMFIVQMIVLFIPNVNKRLVTLIVSLVLSVLSIVSIESIGIIEVVLAVLGQVFAYDFAFQPVKNAIQGK